MLTKTAFFAILNDANNRIGDTVRIAEYAAGDLIIQQDGAPNCALSMHRYPSTTAAAFAKYVAWLNEWLAARAAKAAATAAEAAKIEADRAAGRPVDEEGNDTREWCGNDIQAAHAEALEMDRAHNPTTTQDTDTVNKAKAKQQQNPATLPKPQMVDVLRAVLRMQGEATDAQITAVAAMTETAMRKTITAIINKGARVTAHLVKSKRYGYGALTFGIEGRLPPGAYHALPVKNMKDARNVASQYGALMWNF